MAGSNPNDKPDQELKEYSFKYDPKIAMLYQDRWRWWRWLIFTGVLIAVVAAAFTVGIMRWGTNAYLLLWTTVQPDQRADFRITEIIDETALLLLKPDGTSTQLRLTKNITGTATTQNIIRARGEILAAALSPEKDRVAYLVEADGYRSMTVMEIDALLSLTLERNRLKHPITGGQLEPCSWSPLAWAPDGNRFALFGCSMATSILVLVTAETELTPVILINTEAAQKPPRQLFWLDNSNLVYTHLDAATSRLWTNRIGDQADAIPSPVYQP